MSHNWLRASSIRDLVRLVQRRTPCGRDHFRRHVRKLDEFRHLKTEKDCKDQLRLVIGLEL